MASSGKTTYAKLPKWVATDKPEMQDFNEAFEGIDAEIESINTEISKKADIETIKVSELLNGFRGTVSIVKIHSLYMIDCLLSNPVESVSLPIDIFKIPGFSMKSARTFIVNKRGIAGSTMGHYRIDLSKDGILAISGGVTFSGTTSSIDNTLQPNFPADISIVVNT